MLAGYPVSLKPQAVNVLKGAHKYIGGGTIIGHIANASLHLTASLTDRYNIQYIKPLE